MTLTQPYSLVIVPGAPALAQCHGCGAVVGSMSLHDAWHNDVITAKELA